MLPKQEVGLSYIGQEKSSIVALVELGPIWIADKKFGQTINAIQMKVFKQQNKNLYTLFFLLSEYGPAI